MNLARATLKATVTEDGRCELQEHVKPGDVYYVDLDRIQPLRWRHTDGPVATERESIFVDASPTGAPGWLPLELLDIPAMRGIA